MFDWIGDAIDWIGDGISSLWDSTVGSAVDAITDEIWDIMFSWLFNLIYGAVADLFEFINKSTSNIFALSWVQSFIALFHSLAWMLFVCGLIVAVFDTAIAYESGQANIKNTCLNVLKGFMAASLVTVVPQRLYAFSAASVSRPTGPPLYISMIARSILRSSSSRPSASTSIRLRPIRATSRSMIH